MRSPREELLIGMLKTAVWHLEAAKDILIKAQDIGLSPVVTTSEGLLAQDLGVDLGQLRVVMSAVKKTCEEFMGNTE